VFGFFFANNVPLTVVMTDKTVSRFGLSPKRSVLSVVFRFPFLSPKILRGEICFINYSAFLIYVG